VEVYAPISGTNASYILGLVCDTTVGETGKVEPLFITDCLLHHVQVSITSASINN